VVTLCIRIEELLRNDSLERLLLGCRAAGLGRLAMMDRGYSGVGLTTTSLDIEVRVGGM
jgi:hypothetical protein